MLKVGAIWHLTHDRLVGKSYAVKEGCWVFVSECGKYWCGWGKSSAATRIIPGIGDELPETGRVSMDRTEAFDWEEVKKDLLNNKLGTPDEGVSPFSDGRAVVASSGSCTCDLQVVMARGCPSISGGACPNAKWDAEY